MCFLAGLRLYGGPNDLEGQSLTGHVSGLYKAAGTADISYCELWYINRLRYKSVVWSVVKSSLEWLKVV